MKVGEYVRTEISSLNLQRIGKIKEIISEYFIHTDIGTYDKEHIIKSSPNIIDLIEVGDYVNGYLITSVYDDDSIANEYNLKHKKCLGKNIYDEDFQEYLIYEEDIKSIVTHEQFSQMEYRIGE